MSQPVNINLPTPPAELKTIAPYVSRAQELKGKDPVIAYYCLYHAVQTGIGLPSGKESRIYLNNLMTSLENMKDQLKDRKEITSDESAATYIENFALKVFANADNEDRKGGSNRSTAKKFLAASNFFELLIIFDKKYLNPNIQYEEKIKYSKWKAADIAKAYREGRKPHPGPASTMYTSEDEFGERHSDLEEMSAGSSAAKPASSSARDSQAETEAPPTAKPSLHTEGSASSIDTVTHTKSPPGVLPKHIFTPSMPPNNYVVEVSSPSPQSSTGPKTPLKSPLPDGQWSTAATPGLDSPLAGSWGRAALNSLSPSIQAMLNAANKADGKLESPLSPGVSPKPRSALGGTVITASDLEKKDAGDSADTDEEDSWSIAGNDPYSRQNSMMPGKSFNAPGLVVTPSLGAVHEEASPNKTPTTDKALVVPLPPSTTNSVSSSPESRPSSVAFAASHPLPPLLPPSTKTPSSIKSESHALPSTNSEEKVFKYTSTVGGDSTSDGEASYNVSKRPSTAPKKDGLKADEEAQSSQHVRSSSTNSASLSISPPPLTAKTVAAPMSAPVGPATKDPNLPDDDWERVSLSRLARLPNGGNDGDDLSGRLRDLGSSSSSVNLPSTTNGTSATEDHDFKSRRNTIRAGDRGSIDFNSLNLPGVPSAPPIGEWRRGSGSSDGDSGGEGDVMAKLPSAPHIPPNVQDQLPHVAVYHKPASPREELRDNPHFPAPPPTVTSPSLNGHEDSSLTPRNTTHSRQASTTSYAPPAIPPPPPIQYTHPGAFSPPGVTSPGNITGLPAQYGQPTYPQQHPLVSPPPITYAPVPPTAYAPVIQPNGINGTHDEFGLGVPAREPPTELDPETIGKVQKHTKFALSALNFEDLETAREELKKALRLLS